MTGGGSGDPSVEKFAPNGGQFVAVVGGLVVLAFLVSWAVDIHRVPLWVPAFALVGGVVIYASTVRPRVLVREGELVLRNMLSTVTVPLAAIEEVVIQQVMAVRAGGKRYVCAGVGRTMRQAMKGSVAGRARSQMGGLRGQLAQAQAHEPGIAYADFVELRVRELINEDRMRRGVAKYSDEAEELARQVRREWAWPEIALLTATLVLAVAAVVLD